jgi:hypothetical protein
MPTATDAAKARNISARQGLRRMAIILKKSGGDGCNM